MLYVIIIAIEVICTDTMMGARLDRYMSGIGTPYINSLELAGLTVFLSLPLSKALGIGASMSI
jgi:hypothetical protein